LRLKIIPVAKSILISEMWQLDPDGNLEDVADAGGSPVGGDGDFYGQGIFLNGKGKGCCSQMF